MSDDTNERPAHEILETLDYDATLTKLGAWKGRQVSVHATGPETDVAFAHLSTEGVLGVVIRMEEPRGVDGVMVPIGEAREGYDNCAHPSYLTMSRGLHVLSRHERVTRDLAGGPSVELELLRLEFSSGFGLQVTLLADGEL